MLGKRLAGVNYLGDKVIVVDQATLIATQPVAQRNQRVLASPGCVVPTFQRRDPEAHVQARVGVTPRLGRQDQQRIAQPPRLGG
jgi:hypothetical protein